MGVFSGTHARFKNTLFDHNVGIGIDKRYPIGANWGARYFYVKFGVIGALSRPYVAVGVHIVQHPQHGASMHRPALLRVK